MNRAATTMFHCSWPRLVILLIAVPSTPARAFDPFEIQVYDGTIDKRGEFGLEVHLNRQPDGARVTFEPSFGITDFWELGGYLQTAHGNYEGLKLRTKFVQERGLFRLGLNCEISLEPGARWGGEIRPIFAFENDRFLVAANPNIEFPLAFSPGAMAKIKLGPVAIGPEYYATVPDEQYLF